MAHKPGLGKGLDAIFQSDAQGSIPSSDNFVPVSKIVYNPLQPRREINSSELEELAASIREHGIIQPLVVTYDAVTDQYALIAGERRLRAAILANLSVVPVIIRQADEKERLELALIENIQRSDLSPLDTAYAYQQLNDEFGLSHDEIAVRVGKSRALITNTIRLLKLPPAVQSKLADNSISEGHARTLLGLISPQAQAAALQTILTLGLNVRQTEALVNKLTGEKPQRKEKTTIPAEIRHIEERLRNHFGTKVNLSYGKNGGSIVVHYYSDEELDTILAKILND